MMERKYLGGKAKTTDNKGFSLVEVLVCVAILVIICIPLFSGFQYAALNTRKSHSTQNITEYAQETMENVKTISIDDLRTQILTATDPDGNPSGIVTAPVTNTSLWASYPTYPESFFQTLNFKQTKVKVGGELYDMDLTLDPTRYSSDAPGTTAADANVYAVTDVDQIDGMLFPVIADEINSHENGIGGGGVLYDLLSQVRENQLASFGLNEQARLQNIYANTVKTIKVTVKQEGTEATQTLGGVDYISNTIKVICDLQYKTNYAGIELEQIYNAYIGTFSIRAAKQSDGSVEWEKGGKIFIFAKAYQDQATTFSGLNFGANHIDITSDYSGTGKLEVYLVRGCYGSLAPTGIDTRHGMNFNTVTVNGGVYSTVPSLTLLTGEADYGNIQLKTNIKGAISNMVLSNADIEQTVGMEKPRLRCYEVLLEFTDAKGDKVVSMTSTKQMAE